MLRRLRRLNYRIRTFLRGVEKIPDLLVHESLQTLLKDPRYQDPKNLIKHGYKIYSQNEEDGIIKEIFNRIGVTTKRFVEFGVGNGLENNTLALLFEGWRGLWIEGSDKSTRLIRENLKNAIEAGDLKVVHAFVTKDNINDLIAHAVDQAEIDLLSIDINGNDIHVFNSITCIKPRVVVIEYNAKFPPPILFCMEYDEAHTWTNDDFFGASLKYLEIEFHQRGYRLVGCNLTGTNAFFVSGELVGDRFLAPFSAENHYEPARNYLIGFSAGHRPSYKTLEKSLRMRSS